MQEENKDMLLSIEYIDLGIKIFKSIFSYYFLPILLIINLMDLYTLLTYENLDDLGKAFAGSGVFLIGFLVVSFSILIFFTSIIFLKKKYYKLDISKNHIIINSKYMYDIQNIEYINMPYISSISRWFQLKEKNTEKLIGHFNYRFYDTYFFYNTPEVIEKLINSNSLDNKELIENLIKEDKLSCLALEKRNEKIRFFTIILFAILIGQSLLMVLIRQQYNI